MKVALVADSAVNIPEELLQEYRIQVVPLLFNLEDKTYRDTIDIKTPNELFELIAKSKKFPTTSAPPPSAYLEVYRQLSREMEPLNQYKEVFCFSLYSILAAIRASSQECS